MPEPSEFSTADISDVHPVQVVAPGLCHFGGRRLFHGAIATLEAYEDNSLVRRMLEQQGGGRVLVVDGGGSLRCAMLGDRLAQVAIDRGWAGVVIFGCIRDSAQIAAMPLGVMALATNPQKSRKRGEGEMDVPVRFLDVVFRPGEWLYADGDGIVLTERPV